MEINQRIRLLKKTLLFLLLATTCGRLVASNLPEHSPVPGGIAVIQLPIQPLPNTPPPAAYYRDTRVILAADDQQVWHAIIGIPLAAKPGTHQLILDQGKKIAFTVQPKTYQEQRITLSNKRQVNPAPMDMERIGREKDYGGGIYELGQPANAFVNTTQTGDWSLQQPLWLATILQRPASQPP